VTTIRVARRDRFVTVQQSTVRDPQLSLRAVGLLVRLLSYPDNWRINSIEIARSTREGRDAVRRALAELETAGYLTRNRCQTTRGRWVTELVLRETPGGTDDGFSGVGDGFPGVGKPGVGKPGAIEKTVTKDCRGENSSTGESCCDGTGWVYDEVDRTVERCACNPRSPARRTRARS
jgi:hypothetical protein